MRRLLGWIQVKLLLWLSIDQITSVIDTMATSLQALSNRQLLFARTLPGLQKSQEEFATLFKTQGTLIAELRERLEWHERNSEVLRMSKKKLLAKREEHAQRQAVKAEEAAAQAAATREKFEAREREANGPKILTDDEAAQIHERLGASLHS